MAVEPIGTGAPVDLAHMDQIAGQPHARVVVQQARLVQRAHGLVDHRHARASLAHISRKLAGIGCIGQRAFVQRIKNGLAAVLPDMTEIGAPTELEHQLVLHLERMAPLHARQDLSQADKAMGDVRRQARDRAVEGIAAARIGRRINRRDARLRGSQAGLESSRCGRLAPVSLGKAGASYCLSCTRSCPFLPLSPVSLLMINTTASQHRVRHGAPLRQGYCGSTARVYCMPGRPGSRGVKPPFS